MLKQVLMPLVLAACFASAAHGQAVPDACTRYDNLLTTTPSPPRTAAAWSHHENAVRQAVQRPSVVVLGDSLVERWPSDLLSKLFDGRTVLNLGVSGDRTQNVLWRLQAPEFQSLQPDLVLILAGTNNLGDNAKPCAILAGLTAVATKANTLWPNARVAFLPIPPRGPAGEYRSQDRLQVNSGMRSLTASEKWLHYGPSTEPLSQQPGIYQPDLLHLTRAGYQALGQIIRVGCALCVAQLRPSR
jgi:lysophospholipase L1-like esterase